MKTINNITSVLLFIALVPVIYVSYKLMDTWAALKVNIDDLPQPESIEQGKQGYVKTVYPDDMPKNFNDWSIYINKQLN